MKAIFPMRTQIANSVRFTKKTLFCLYPPINLCHCRGSIEKTRCFSMAGVWGQPLFPGVYFFTEIWSFVICINFFLSEVLSGAKS